MENLNKVLQAPTTAAKTALEESFVKRLGSKCTQKDNSSCVMLKLVTYMNRLLKKSSIALGESVELTQTRSTEEPADDSEEMSVLARAASSDDHKLSVLVADKIWRFIQSRSVKWRAFQAADIVVASGEGGKLNFGVSLDTRKLVEEGRGKMKQHQHLLMAFVMKAGIIGALILKGIALLVGKALLVSKLALLLASVLGIKKLLSKKHVTYEVVAHAPEHHHHLDTYSSGWARAIDGFVETFSKGLENRLMKADTSADELAYGGQRPLTQ
ncbi:Osiris [Culex quinquefasciatus]|uniref:Osiris n=1 Tax=Culex quinquefasciatus TaxID=7176 RepID=B0WLW7_CULQU|nr:Osiris [Culex quinquefasciatus]|eukprot:XP_001849701.1 Osiris [Culex quinquefasciatus]